jgi:hypothetical protein
LPWAGMLFPLRGGIPDRATSKVAPGAPTFLSGSLEVASQPQAASRTKKTRNSDGAHDKALGPCMHTGCMGQGSKGGLVLI